MTRKSWFMAIITALINAGLYLCFAANIGWREVIASVGVGAISTLAVKVFARAGRIHFSFRFRDVVQAWQIPWYVLTGTIDVFRAMGKQMFASEGAASFLTAVRFDIGEHDSMEDEGRRALAITYTTATPNFVILGIVEEQRLMLYHQVLPGKVPVMTQKLGARP